MSLIRVPSGVGDGGTNIDLLNPDSTIMNVWSQASSKLSLSVTQIPKYVILYVNVKGSGSGSSFKLFNIFIDISNEMVYEVENTSNSNVNFVVGTKTYSDIVDSVSSNAVVIKTFTGYASDYQSRYCALIYY